jgi:putative transposase
MGFIDTMRSEGHAVESVCRVLREQGCQVAARTYRAWKRAQPSARDLDDAYLINAIWDLFPERDEASGEWRLTPESVYGRRKMTALLRRSGHSAVAHCTVARCLNTMGHKGIRRVKKVRTTIPAKDGRRAGDLLDRDFTTVAPNRVWATDFTYVRTWAGFVYVASSSTSTRGGSSPGTPPRASTSTWS